MSFREFFVTRLGPGGLSGVSLGLWLRILWDNRFAVSPEHLFRAGAATSCAVQNSLVGAAENWIYGRRIRQTKVEAPLFVLGSWRSGTTHLHNLLAQDERFAFPNFYQVIYPRIFLLTERVSAPIYAAILPKTRPQEDEFAINNLCGCSFALGWAFPRRREAYQRFMTLRGASPDEVRRWKEALMWFAQKLTLKYGRPLVFKSPAHTGRIRLLLELFPDARFVHIRRHPHDVYSSTVHTMRKVYPWWGMQCHDLAGLQEEAIAMYRELYDVYFEEKSLIPPGRLHELAYEDLGRDPLGELRRAYESLSLPDFAAAQPKLRSYLEQVQSYRKNEFAPLAEPLRQRLATEWKPCFDEWGYAP